MFFPTHPHTVNSSDQSADVSTNRTQMNEPPQHLQPDGTMATNNLRIFGYLTLVWHIQKTVVID